MVYEVFLYNPKIDMRSEALGTYRTPQLAEQAVAEYRAKGLPAYYAKLGTIPIRKTAPVIPTDYGSRHPHVRRKATQKNKKVGKSRTPIQGSLFSTV